MGKKIVLAGGSGFLGQSLAQFLIKRNYDVVVLTRGAASTTRDGVRYAHWDGVNLGEWATEIEGCESIVNFTGKSVNCIYTKANKEEILSSRLNSVKVLRDAIHQCSEPPQSFIQAGSLAIFGDTKQECDEEAPHGTGFSVDVCKQWEDEFFRVSFPHTRQVLLRIGFVLGKNGGALEPLKTLVKFNLGGTVGSGKQYISWLHIDDLNHMFLEAIEQDQYDGIYNATGPTPVTNKTFMKTLRDAMGKGWTPPAPTPFVWLGAYIFMRTEPSLALTGRNCIPKKFLDAGFEFKYTDLGTTLSELVS
ncbi:TIGR01777 family oxidoreductase [Caldalkalibacillus salinus]|uniref:TIGR01777 family oxidoreductase n=1 Tax=Caldalkalibacillus salinus TaxID=2803787 RepID=UPI001920C061|nr:TIGR01777 family oxidoreductase [Caldalkalibacillus salinus]